MKSKKKFDLKNLFNSIVKKYPQNVALNFGNNEKYTFKDLDEISDKFLYLFSKLKIKPYEVIAIDSVKNIYSFALIISCIKNRNPYSFIEISKYNHRLPKILNTLKHKKTFIFSKKKIKNSFLINEKNFFSINTNLKYKKTTFNLIKKNTIAYIMFT